MTEKKFNFTDERLRKLVPEIGKRTWYFDSNKDGPCLTVMVTPTGSKSFKFKAWDSLRGKSGVLTLGSCLKISLFDARKKAAELALNLSNGVDIWTRKADERNEPTLDEAFNRWVEKKTAKGRSSWKLDKLRYNKHIKPRWGRKRVCDITTKHLENWFLSLPQKTGLSTTSANRLLVIIKTMFNQELRQYPNPCIGIDLNREESRERFLRPHELPQFFAALEATETPDYLRDFVYLGLYTGARKANLLGMRWADIDFAMELWTIPAALSKNKASITVPIIPAALEILSRRREENRNITKPSFFVFPSISPKSKTGHLHDIRDSWEAMLNRAGLTDFRIHDLRRSLGSWQTITGASTAVVGKSLGHKSQQATAVYARMHLDPVRESIEKAIAAMQAAREVPDRVVMLTNK